MPPSAASPVPPAAGAGTVLPPQPARTTGRPAASSGTAGCAAGGGGEINLNTVTFEQLRGENLSVTQATRLLAHRERLGRFGSVDDLDQVPGFPQEVLDDLKRRSTV